ncbi:MAG: FAD-dependent oxidoreductase [Alphaproteobacteria bacterium]|nr:FAD-dependent oxidoreductase [Alphaproteobacteria bacterium]
MATARGSYDVVILGSGIAGLAGALAAHELGLRPVVLEKAALLGGGTVHSYGLIWVGQNHLASEAGIADSRDEVLAYMRFLGGGAVDAHRLAAFIDRSPEMLRFFAERGIRFRLVRGAADHYYDKAPGSHAVGRTVEAELISGNELAEWRDRVLVPHDVPCFVTAEEQIAWGGINNASHWDADLVAERRSRDMRGKGLGLICQFVAALRDRGVPMLTGQAVERLAVHNGRVTGVLLGSGELIEARRGVIIATGGYGADPQISWEFEQLPGFEHEDSGLIPQSLTGDGIVLGAEIGGIVHKIENSLRVMLSYTIPAEAPGGTATSVHAGIVELCSPHTLLVNRLGQRFADETFFQGIVPQLRLFDPERHQYPNLPAYLIFDAQYLERFSFANRPVGSPVPQTVARADTLSDLAAMLSIEPGGLQKTVSRFNDFVARGGDEDFHRGEHQWKLASRPQQGGNGSLGAVEKPPFYGIELHPAGGSSVGLLTDAHARVKHQRRQPIPGLYTSGNAAAATEQGIGYQAGLSLAAAMTFSVLAVRHMLSD